MNNSLCFAVVTTESCLFTLLFHHMLDTLYKVFMLLFSEGKLMKSSSGSSSSQSRVDIQPTHFNSSNSKLKSRYVAHFHQQSVIIMASLNLCSTYNLPQRQQHSKFMALLYQHFVLVISNAFTHILIQFRCLLMIFAHSQFFTGVLLYLLGNCQRKMHL